jgi:hypothetical protein
LRISTNSKTKSFLKTNKCSLKFIEFLESTYRICSWPRKASSQMYHKLRTLNYCPKPSPSARINRARSLARNFGTTKNSKFSFK